MLKEIQIFLVNLCALLPYFIQGLAFYYLQLGYINIALLFTLLAPLIEELYRGFARLFNVNSTFGATLKLITNFTNFTNFTTLIIIWHSAGICGLTEIVIMWCASALRHSFFMVNMDLYKCKVTISIKKYTLNLGWSNKFIPFVTLFFHYILGNYELNNFLIVVQSIGMVFPLIKKINNYDKIYGRTLIAFLFIYIGINYFLVSEFIMKIWGTIMLFLALNELNSFNKNKLLIILVWILPLFYYLHYDIKYIFKVIFVNWTSDAIQLFGGKFCQKKGLLNQTPFPTISPNKTVGGYIFGLVFTRAFCNFINWFFNLNIEISLLFSIFLITTGMIGDILMSYCKRMNHLKDSSSFVLSHGGILDRIDSLGFPLFIYTIKLFITSW